MTPWHMALSANREDDRKASLETDYKVVNNGECPVFIMIESRDPRVGCATPKFVLLPWILSL